MPRRPRFAVVAEYYHVINRSVRRAPLFDERPDYLAFLAVLRAGLELHPARLLAYCVMNNHWHLVLGPGNPRRLSQLMQWVTATHARRWHRRRGTDGQGPVYQGRFQSVPLGDAEAIIRVCRYVERNALSAQLVRRAEDWPWSSLNDRRRRHPRLPLEGLPFLLSDFWVDHVNAAVTFEEQNVLCPQSA